ncbi:MAG: hypothetical protein ACTJH9_02110 [Pseudoalteromonas sp.]|uniref:hypothetical protein n=1 Tax=unclassified Pseudoalteromonas TaxID=194690 RepID=UPI003F9B8085
MNIYKLCGCLGLMTLSFASQAKYNEAMCILLKQQINQYSDNQGSRNYRNAARDYKNNCNKPQPAAEDGSNTPSKNTQINTQTNTETPEPIKPIVTQPTAKPINETQTKVVPEDIAEQPQPVNNQTETVDTHAVEPKSAQPETVPLESIKANTATSEALKETVSSKVTGPAIPAGKPETPSNQQTPFLMPSVLLILILLFLGVIVSRLRKKNKTTDDKISHSVLSDQASQLATKAKAQPKTLAETEDKAPSSTVDVSSQKSKTTEVESAEPESSEPENNESKIDKPEIDYPVFEPHPLDEQSITSSPEPEKSKDSHPDVKKVYEFDEPEIRIYDPNAPLPGQKGYIKSSAANTHLSAPQSETPGKNQTISPNLCDKEAAEVNDEDVAKESLKAKDLEPQAFEVKEPECDVTESQSHQPKTKKADSSNPFANLSLDPSWDPESTQKPTIVEAKTEPKSQALIDAEQRAKQLTTDD